MTIVTIVNAPVIDAAHMILDLTKNEVLHPESNN
jgi:hypothetical protein